MGVWAEAAAGCWAGSVLAGGVTPPWARARPASSSSAPHVSREGFRTEGVKSAVSKSLQKYGLFYLVFMSFLLSVRCRSRSKPLTGKAD